ncbi:sensor histidine kinase [Thermocatellispora tengchongensis]|uniref:sensor histidine kinase n=1 Tax=Thermocatellispora tengchongensis TaxID=1073253 RepID=UPI003389C62D
MKTTGRQQVGDAVLALVLTALALVVTGAGAAYYAAPGQRLDMLGGAFVAATGLALAVRRRWPAAVLAVATVSTAAYLVLGYPYGLIMVCFLVAVYTAARHLPPARSVPLAVAALVLLLAHIFTNDAALPGALGLIPASAWVIVPLSAGITVRVVRESAARERAETIRRRVDGERLRVAQEVHDIVGHGLAAIKMQADVALHLLARKPEQARVALEAISRTSGTALDELRATLAAVRENDTVRSPAASLSRLDELRQRMSEAGVQVRLERSGTPRPLPEAVDLTGYRVVQESLTNVLRHGGAGQATVSVRYAPDAVILAITNPVAGEPARGGGLGIPGMRDRVLALGGEFSAGPAPGDRFEVHASLPIGGHP